MTMTHITRSLLVSLALSAVACGGSGKEAETPDAVDEDGAMEEAGEEMDEAAEEMGDEMEEMGDEMEETVEE
jgi:hypothetical protein